MAIEEFIMKKVFITLLLLFAGLIFHSPEELQAQQAQKIVLAGYNHSPPVSTPGSGMATITLKEDTITVKGDFENLTSSFSGAYLMVKLRGQPGNQLYRLKTELNEERTGGIFNPSENKFALSPAELKLLKEGELYINITSSENRKGELRGDIKPMGK